MCRLPFRLIGEPVADVHAFGLGAFDACDAGGQVRRQQPVVGGLDRQLADGGATRSQWRW
jgi:hypothetical protein